MITKERAELIANYYLMIGDRFRAAAYKRPNEPLHDIVIPPRTMPKLKKFVELIKVLGAGPETVNKWIRAGIGNLADLGAALVRNPARFTKMQAYGIKYYNEFQRRIVRAEVERVGQIIIELLNRAAGDTSRFISTIAGSYRRGALSSLDIDIVTTAPINHLVDNRIEYITRGPNKCMCLWKDPIVCVDLVHCEPAAYVPTLFYLTGSGRFNQQVRAHAAKLGMKLSEHGLVDRHGRHIVVKSEEELFQALGLAYVLPEERN